MALIDTENEEIKVLFNNILWLSNQPVVIKKGNYFNKKTGDLGNICSEIQNFIYENFGIAFAKSNMLTGENKTNFDKTVEQYKKEKNK